MLSAFKLLCRQYSSAFVKELQTICSMSIFVSVVLIYSFFEYLCLALGNINILSSKHIFKTFASSIHHNLNSDHTLLHRLIPNYWHVCFQHLHQCLRCHCPKHLLTRSFQVPLMTSSWLQLQHRIPCLVKSLLISICSPLLNPFPKLPLISFLQGGRSSNLIILSCFN